MIELNKPKKCPRCNEYKLYNADNFFRTKDKRLGLMYHCKVCHMASQKNSEKWKKYQSEYNYKYYHDNKEKENKRYKEYSEKNRSSIRKREREYYRENPTHRLRKLMSCVLRYSIRSCKNNENTFDLLGYNIDELKDHLEMQFSDGMTWDNYGDWHVDHIKPIAAFGDLEIGSDSFKECWSLSNLQPLWAYDNKSKGSLWNDERHFLRRTKPLKSGLREDNTNGSN